MAKVRDKDTSGAPSTPPGEAVGLAREEGEAIRQLKEAVRSGKEWQVALLEAVSLWTLPAEEFLGRHYQYLVHGEAFDWLLLAERLCYELDGVVPIEEKEQLLLRGKLGSNVSTRDFQQLIGYNKHRAYLNYYYGVVVEEALQLAVEEEVRKQHLARGFSDSEDLVEEAFVRIYEATKTDLLKTYLGERTGKAAKSLTLTELKEFTYWLFKRRLEMWDPARVASDTRKGLDKLRVLWVSDEPSSPKGADS